MATIKDVAIEAGVGVGTASRALSGGGSVKPETKKRIEDAAKRLGFVPNQQARNLKKQSTGCIAVLCPTIYHPFFAKMALYIENEIYALGDRMVVVSSQDNLEKEKTILEMIEEKRVDGIVFITHYDHGDIDPTLPIVSLDRHFGAGIPYVTSNNYEISREAVERLIASGSKKVGCVCGVTVVESETKYRYEAYLDTMTAHSLPARLLKKQFRHGEEMAVMREFFEAYPDVDGIFAGSDMLANAAYHVAAERGKRVPEDLQIIGFDGVLDAWRGHPKLTTVEQDIPALAREAVGLLMKRIRHEEVPARVEVPARIVEGETTR